MATKQPSEDNPDADNKRLLKRIIELIDRVPKFSDLPLSIEEFIELLTSMVKPWQKIVKLLDQVHGVDQDQYDRAINTLHQIMLEQRVQFLSAPYDAQLLELLLAYLTLTDSDPIRNYLSYSDSKSRESQVKKDVVMALCFILKMIVFDTTSINSQALEKYNGLLVKMIRYIDKKLSKQHALGLQDAEILDLLLSLSDKVMLVPFLLKTDLPKYCIRWLYAESIEKSDLETVITILSNLSRHDEGADELNRLNTLTILKDWQKTYKNLTPHTNFFLTLLFAYLSSDEEIKTTPKLTEDVLDELVTFVARAAEDSSYREDGIHISESLSALVKLFINDSNVDYVVRQPVQNPKTSDSAINFFSNLLVNFSKTLEEQDDLKQYTFLALCNIIWSISFRDRYREELKNNRQLIKVVKTIARNSPSLSIDKYIPRSMISVNQAANGILVNLDLDKLAEDPVIDDKNSDKRKPLVMISYCHANSAFCDKLLELLDEKSEFFDVWIDKRFCKTSADVWELIAKAIKDAKLVVPVISPEYLASKACRQEVIYAKDRLNKSFLPVYMDKPEVTDWLDIRLAEFKYVRFLNPDSKLDERKIEEFVTTLIESLQVKDEPVNKDNKKSESAEKANAVDETNENADDDTADITGWGSDEINQWFEENSISKEIRDLYRFKTGAQLLAYAEFLGNDGVVKQYEQYKKLYEKRYPGETLLEHEFASFAGALKTLSSQST